jgi:hypothetical protein
MIRRASASGAKRSAGRPLAAWGAGAMDEHPRPCAELCRGRGAAALRGHASSARGPAGAAGRQTPASRHAPEGGSRGLGAAARLHLLDVHAQQLEDALDRAGHAVGAPERRGAGSAGRAAAHEGPAGAIAGAAAAEPGPRVCGGNRVLRSVRGSIEGRRRSGARDIRPEQRATYCVWSSLVKRNPSFRNTLVLRVFQLYSFCCRELAELVGSGREGRKGQWRDGGTWPGTCEGATGRVVPCPPPLGAPCVLPKARATETPCWVPWAVPLGHGFTMITATDCKPAQAPCAPVVVQLDQLREEVGHHLRHKDCRSGAAGRGAGAWSALRGIPAWPLLQRAPTHRRWSPLLAPSRQAGCLVSGCWAAGHRACQAAAVRAHLHH